MKVAMAPLPLGLSSLRALNFPRKLGLLERLYGSALARHGTSLITAWNGRTWKLDLTDSSQRWIVYGVYEGEGWLRWLRPFLVDGGVVVESGANIGQTLMYYAFDPKLRVFAFEPDPASREWLTECLQLQADGSVEIVAAGLGAEATMLQLQCHGARSTMQMNWYKRLALDTVQVPVVALDDWSRDRGIDRIRFWKLDVEGHELAALRGAATLLANRAIDAILIEVAAECFAPLRLELEKFGYRLFRIGANGSLVQADRFVEFGNLLALSTEESARAAL